MVFKGLLHTGVRKGSRRTERLVHGLQLRGEHLSKVLPEDGLLAVEDVRAALGLVDVLQIVGEHEGTFVIDSDGRIEVVGQPHDLFLHSSAHSSPPSSSSSSTRLVPMKLGNAFLARESTMRNSSVKR